MTHTLLALATLASAPGAAASPDARCADDRIRVVGALDERWQGALARACAALATMADRDPRGRVTLLSSAHGLVLEVTAASGKSATRRVEQPDALLPTLQALLTIPGGSGPVAQAVEPELPSKAITPGEAAATVARPVADRLEVSVGGTFGARLAGPRAFLFASPGGFIQVATGAWAVAVGMRWDEMLVAEDVVTPGFEMDALSVSLAVARRWPLSFGRFDVAFSPRLIAETQSYGSPTGERAGTSTDIRPALGARLEVGRRGVRFLVDVDADVSPSRLQRAVRIAPELPRLPGWSLGLAAGVAWSAP